MGTLIIIIAWFSVGFIYLLNLTASDEFENLTDEARAIVLLIFLPTTTAIYIILGIEKIIKRIRNGKM